MKKPAFTRAHAEALVGLLFLAVLVVVCYHSLAGGTLLQKNFSDSYLLQAQNWLAGNLHIANGQSYPWLELAVYQGEYYQSFPPVPALFCLPLAAVGAQLSNLMQLFYLLATVCGVYFALWQGGASARSCGAYTLLFTLASNALLLGCSGAVWYIAQLLNLCLWAWALFLWQRNQYSASFLLMALAVGCRPFSAILAVVLFCAVALPQLRQRQYLRTAKMAVLPLLVALALAWYNHARFGALLEFGRSYLPEFTAQGKAQFSLDYFLRSLKNLLRPVTLNAQLALEYPTFNGFLPMLTSPIFGLGAVQTVRLMRKRALKALDIAVLVGCVANLACLMLHKTLGGWQFGSRYMVDLFPYLMLLLVRNPKETGTKTDLLVLAALVFNLYGVTAVYLMG